MGFFGNSDEVASLRRRIANLEQRLDTVTREIGMSVPPEPAGMAEVRQLKADGQEIAAIKRLREIEPRLGLADAKAIVDDL